MCSNIAIKVSGVGKNYHIYDRPIDRLKQSFCRGKKKYYSEFMALNNVSIEINKGETVGIMGKNGSGKSTFLQILCGTLTPTFGDVQVNGRVAALLELGAGFNPEFTGRENVYLNATVLGLSKDEIDVRFNEIVEFADIGDFINQPVKCYSSGMYVRLAFSVIAHVDADILIIDEALSVGDVFFQQKCMRFLKSFQEGGGTILFVSHDMGSVAKLCDRAMLLPLNKSSDIVVGRAKEICEKYLEQTYAERKLTGVKVLENSNMEKTKEFVGTDKIVHGNAQPVNVYKISGLNSKVEDFGERGASIIDAYFVSAEGEVVDSVKGGEKVTLLIRVESSQKVIKPAFGFMIKDRLGQYLYTEGTDQAFENHEIGLKMGDVVDIKFNFNMPILIRGEYSINVAVADGVGDDHIQQHWIHDAITITSVSSRLVHGIGGVHDLSISMEWARDGGEMGL